FLINHVATQLSNPKALSSPQSQSLYHENVDVAHQPLPMLAAVAHADLGCLAPQQSPSLLACSQIRWLPKPCALNGDLMVIEPTAGLSWSGVGLDRHRAFCAELYPALLTHEAPAASLNHH